MPFISTIFLFIFVSNWSGALIPWKMFEIPAGLSVPKNIRGKGDGKKRKAPDGSRPKSRF